MVHSLVGNNEVFSSCNGRSLPQLGSRDFRSVLEPRTLFPTIRLDLSPSSRVSQPVCILPSIFPSTTCCPSISSILTTFKRENTTYYGFNPHHLPLHPSAISLNIFSSRIHHEARESLVCSSGSSFGRCQFGSSFQLWPRTSRHCPRGKNNIRVRLGHSPCHRPST